MKTKELKDSLRELLAWWSSEPQQFRNLVLSILGALPGGESLNDVVEPALMGWKETDMLAKLLSAIRSEQDVRYVADKLLRENELNAVETPPAAEKYERSAASRNA